MTFSKNMKTLVTLSAAVMLLATGCTSTVTLGPKANESQVIGASAGTSGASLTLPLVKGEVSPAEKTTPKK
jgi:outer membrane biogenesis lipoprotein LolB